MLLSKWKYGIIVNIAAYCKRFQVITNYVKSIIKDDKSVLRTKKIFIKAHYQHSKCCIQNVTIKPYQLIVNILINFLMTFGLINSSQWLTLNNLVFFFAVSHSWLWDSQNAVKKGRSNGRIHLADGEERLAGECMGTLLWSGWINDWNTHVLWSTFCSVCLLTETLSTIV